MKGRNNNNLVRFIEELDDENRSLISKLLYSQSITPKDDFNFLSKLLINNDLDAEVRSCLAWLMGKIRHKRHANQLLELFVRENERLVYWELAKSLVSVQNEHITTELISIMKNPDEADKRVASAYVLGFSGDAEVTSVLSDLLCDTKINSELRFQIEDSLSLSASENKQ